MLRGGQEGISNHLVRSDGLTEFEILHGSETDRLTDGQCCQFFGYLDEAGAGYNRMPGEMAGKDRMSSLEMHRVSGRLTLVYDIEAIA